MSLSYSNLVDTLCVCPYLLACELISASGDQCRLWVPFFLYVCVMTRFQCEMVTPPFPVETGTALFFSRG